jgi:hypothetical protein
MLVLGLSTLPDIYRSMLPSDVLGPMNVQSLRLNTVQSRLEDFFESEYLVASCSDIATVPLLCVPLL